MEKKLLKSIALASALLSANVMAAPEWLRDATLGGTYVDRFMDEQELNALLDLRAEENVSVLELDSRLSEYLTDAQFDVEVDLLDRAAKGAHDRAMKAVIYFPTLEVITLNGVNSQSSMYRDHPDWIQRSITGDANVFYGNQEVWVDPTSESAWMSPNSPYKEYFLERVRKLAATELDGIWLDVPIYLETGAGWAGAGSYAAADFKQWSIDLGIGGAAGYTMPTEVDFNDPAFRAWVKWRHVNLANFIEDVRVAAHEIDPEFTVIIENFPMDYMDATKAGLDATALKMSDKVVQVLETDSVSNETAMAWATTEDFESKITMLKWGKAINYGNASLSFSYGNDILDAGLTLASVIGTGTAPFESKTPEMLRTVDSANRKKWFGFVRNNSDELLATPREANVGVWYSSATRDFHDFPIGGEYGMFSNIVNPNNDPAWWSTDENDSFTKKAHLGGYRGLSAAMTRLHIPYKVITVPGSVASELEGLDIVMLPSVVAMSDFHANALKDYVSAGGVVLATGEVPAVMDAFGGQHSNNPLTDLFGFGATPSRRVNQYGQGLAIYRPDIVAKNVFGMSGSVIDAAYAMAEIERLTRIHTNESFTVENGDNVYIDHGITSDTRKHLYLVNYSGLQQPIVSAPKTVTVHYNAGADYRLDSASLKTPDGDSALTVRNEGHGIYRFDVPVDQFSLVNLGLTAIVPTPPPVYNGPVFADAAQQEAAESGLQFILNSMRNSSLPQPYNYGVHTNLLDNSSGTEVYTNGHHVIGEHMGLLLRTAACMKDETAYNQAYEYVKDAMYSPLYHVPNWSIDKFSQRPFVEYNDRGLWLNANAPLDDMRIIRGLMDGYEKMGRTDAEALAKSMLEGLYWTTVTTNNQTANQFFEEYSGGLLGFAWDWAEVDDASLVPPAVATGQGFLTYGLIPIDYQELGTIGLAAQRDHRWGSVLSSATQLLLDAEIGSSGLFYNGYDVEKIFTGDFEYQGETQGEYLKTIQVLWQAIHLARVSKFDNTYLSNAQLSASAAAARRSLNFYKNYYATNSRVPEYMTMTGGDAPDCSNGLPANCLVRGVENLLFGEARIYAQMARLALLLDDQEFANLVINEKIMTDRISDPSDARYGLIGQSTTSAGDAEAWNVLESVFSLCLNASNETTPPVNTNNRVPVASADSFSTTAGQSFEFTAASLLSNDTDADNDSLQLISVDNAGSQGGSLVAANGNSWSYTSAAGFSGTETFTYTISDGRGGSAQGTISIQVVSIPGGNGAVVVVNPTAVDIQTGALNYGTLPFLTADDVDTYDIDSAPTGQTHTVIWTASESVQNPTQVLSVQMVFAGHYSQPAVTQTTALYNFTTGAWVDLDTRIVGDGTDEVVRLSGGSEYVSPQGLMRTQVRATRSVGSFTSWANSLKWSVTYSETTPPNPPVNPGGAISNIAAGITLDGNLSEWASLQSFGVDPDDITGTNRPLDWKEAWLANDGDNFYLAFTNYGAVTPSWGQTIYFDTDSNSATGWQSGLSIGADYVIQGGVVYRYAGDAAGTVWQWTLTAEMEGTPAADVFEYRFPRAALGNPQAFKVAFVGSNEPYGGDVEDLYPDGVYNTASENRSFTYTVAAPGNSAPVAIGQSVQASMDQSLAITVAGSDFDSDALSFSVVTQPANGSLQGAAPNLTYVPSAGYVGSDQFTFSVSDGRVQSGVATVSVNVLPTGGSQVPSNQVVSITLDGNLDEWQALTGFSDDPDDVTGAINPVDYLGAAMAHSDTSLFVSYQNDQLAVSGIDSWAFNIYLDTDANAGTGYRNGMDIGTDYLQQGTSLYQYAGDGTSWNWLYRGDVQRADSGSTAEVMIDRVAIGNPASINLVFVGDNLSVSGSIEDVYPDGAYDSNNAVRHLSYATDGFVAAAQNTLITGAARAQPVSGRIQLHKNATQPTIVIPGSGGGSSGGGAIELYWLIIGGLFTGLFLRRR